MNNNDILLDIKDLEVTYDTEEGIVHAVNNISFGAGASDRRNAACQGREDFNDLPGSDEQLEPGYHRGRSDCRGAAAP